MFGAEQAGLHHGPTTLVLFVLRDHIRDLADLGKVVVGGRPGRSASENSLSRI